MRPVLLDIKESALAGMGPHGLMVGATGSGKSELLRTLVCGLALMHSPEALALVLVEVVLGVTAYTATGVTLLDGADAALWPLSLVAVTVHVVATPLDNPSTTIGEDAPVFGGTT